MIPKTGKSSKPDNAPIGKDITSDPNANGNGFAEASDLSFLSDLAWGLLTPGQQALLQKSDINPPRNIYELYKNRGRGQL